MGSMSWKGSTVSLEGLHKVPRQTRDGVTLQPPSYVKGQRGWWLQQLVELAPIAFWHQSLDKSPEQLWEWSRRSDWKTALRQGWLG